MTSLLIITPVEKLQIEINSMIKSLGDCFAVYVSLNKSQKSIENILKDNNIDTEKFFFIDCVTSQKTRGDVLHIAPAQLNMLSVAINTFTKLIRKKKFLIIDGLATLLIYNDENNVAKFTKEVTEYASKQDVQVIAFSPKTEGKDLLNKIFNFFDNVEKR